MPMASQRTDSELPLSHAPSPILLSPCPFLSPPPLVPPQAEPPPSHPPSLIPLSPPPLLNPCFPSSQPRPASPPPSPQSGRPLRTRRLPARYQDIYPEPPLPAASSDSSLPAAAVRVLPRVTFIVRNPFKTAPNSFGLWKEYLYHPSYDPDAFISTEDLYRPHTSAIVPDQERTVEETSESVYSNKSTELLMHWQTTGSTKKTDKEVIRLVRDILCHPEFKLDELANFNATRKNQKADAADKKSFLQSFQHASIEIDVLSGNPHEASHVFSIPGLYYRPITTLIKQTFESPISLKFHFSPFKLFRKLPNSEDSECLFSEIYNSDVFLDKHNKVQRAPTGDPTCKREKVIAALMFWSDATHLATFGTAKMWPVYMLFGNLSKYVRCQPNSRATIHLAYIPPLPDSLQDQLKSFHHKWGTQKKDILTHCRRELMHTVWKFLLDDDFLHASTYGMIMRCLDGIERRVYPRILTYSADYPKKYVFASVSSHCHSLPSLGFYLLLFAIRAFVPVRVV